MTRTSLKHFHCSMARTAEIIGDKWSLLILRDVLLGSTSFTQFHRSLGVARNILSNRLDTLVENELLEKRRARPGIERYTYHFTERGRELVPVLIAMMQWGDRWIFGDQAVPLELLDRREHQPIQQIKLLSSAGRELDPADLVPSPGPGADATTRAYFS